MKKLDVEIREGQEELERVTAEGRSLRAANNSLSTENRKFIKANKAMVEGNIALAIEELAHKAALKKLREGLAALRAELDSGKSDIVRETKILNKTFEGCEFAKKEAYEAEAKLDNVKADILDERAKLKKERESFNRERSEADILKEEYKNKLKDLEAKEINALELIRERENDLIMIERQQEKLVGAKLKVDEAKDQYEVKKLECENEKQASIKANKEIEEILKRAKAREKAVTAVEKATAVKQAIVDSKEKSVDSILEALEVRDKETEVRELRVQKLIKEHGLDKELKRLKKQTGE